MELKEELHKQIIRKFEKKLYSSFKHNICSDDLADMQLISKYNKGFPFLLYAIDLFVCKYIWGEKDKKVNEKKVWKLLMFVRKKLNESGCKPRKIWPDQGS